MNPTDQGLDHNRVEELTGQILLPVRANYQRGPISRDRALEALNALAVAAAVVVSGCDGMGGEAEKFFYQALTINIKSYCGRGNPPSPKGGDIESTQE
jgi:hypothetical protein